MKCNPLMTRLGAQIEKQSSYLGLLTDSVQLHLPDD